MAEKEARKLLKKALEDIITTEIAIVSFLKTEYGDAAVTKFYTDYRPQFILELQLGLIRRALAKVAAKIAKKTLLKMIIDTLCEKGEWYQPIDTIHTLNLKKEGATLRIFPCNRKKMFKRIMRKKDKSIEPTYICNIMCTKEIGYYLTFIGLKVNFTLEEKGCVISAVWDPEKMPIGDEVDEEEDQEQVAE